MSLTQLPLDRNVPLAQLADRAVRVGRETLQSRSFVIQGVVYYSSLAQTESERDLLLSFLQHTPIEVYRKNDNRYLLAYTQGIPLTWVDGVELQIRIPMVAPDPLWYEGEVTTSSTTIEVAGNADTSPLITLTVTGAIGAITLSNNNGYEVVLTNTFLLNDVIVIDNNDMTVTVNGTKKISIASNTWQLYGFKLSPGSNVLSVNNATIETKYNPRWY